MIVDVSGVPATAAAGVGGAAPAAVLPGGVGQEAGDSTLERGDGVVGDITIVVQPEDFGNCLDQRYLCARVTRQANGRCESTPGATRVQRCGC